MTAKTDHKPRAGLYFLGLVLLAYLVAGLLEAQRTLAALTLVASMLTALVPALLLVFIFIFVSNLLIRPDWVRRQLGQDSGFRGWLVAVISGLLSVGPVYPWYALLGELREKGMRTALIAVFLYSRGVKLPLMPMLTHYFGLSFTLLLAAYLTLFSLASGLIMQRIIGK